ncbi:glycerophosphodiester phosphodiesterase [Nonomuraea sp. NPDC050790]|uniref:glycerophosphodiester phosphodiesterase n=1 Tax=Nonomuraea sp. NPDC050790 TaxID=3364371 RepID=UPI0037945E59
MFDPDPLIVAHRGAPKVAPENTLAAFHAAGAAGADLYELDVHQTRDGHLVVIHDASLARTTDVEQVFPDRAPWRVRDFTLEEIGTLDAGAWFDQRFAGERVPTLRAVLESMKGGPGLLLEVKHPADAPEVAERLARLMPLAPPLTIVQSFDWQFIRKFQARGQRAVLSRAPALGELTDIAQYAEYVSVKHRLMTPAYVRRAHRLGLKVLAYTVNRRPAMRRVLAAGVDGLITNRPRALRRALETSVCFAAPPELATMMSRLPKGGRLCPPAPSPTTPAPTPAPETPASGTPVHAPVPAPAPVAGTLSTRPIVPLL